ncbi:MAG TPA: hypothetical protein VLB50_05655 [Ignavibacteriaceae bacterium]|nr:hypothetical protein [Ignavibacteriaceae bacterium]
MNNSIFAGRSIELAALLLIILLAGLPFIFNGYGLDADAWRIVQSGYALSAGEGYQPSRFPGYPLPEFISGAVWLLKLPYTIPWIFNFLTLLLSVTAVYYFLLISAEFINKNKLFVYLSTLAFAFTPVFYINSTGIMEYNWALAFALGSSYYLISKRLRLSALFLALAAGCRITSALFIIPSVYFLISSEDTTPRRKIYEYILIFSAACLVLFSPLWLKYGFSFLTFDRPPGEYSILKIAGRFTLRTWGFLGSLGIAFAIIKFLTTEKQEIRNFFTGNKFVVYSFLSIIIYLLLFFQLPLDAGYLMPLVPFVILLLYRMLSKKILIILSVLLIASPFILNIEEHDYSAAGPVFINSEKRISEEQYLDSVISKTESFDQPTIIICEAFLHKLQVTMVLKKISLPGNVDLVYTLPEDSLKTLLNRGSPRIFYLRNIRDVTRKLYGYDLKKYGAEELIERK